MLVLILTIGKITEGLSEETDFALKNLFPPSKGELVKLHSHTRPIA